MRQRARMHVKQLYIKTYNNNMNYELRDSIIFSELVNWKKECGGIKGFNDLSLEKIQKLIKAKMLNMRDRQNDSPTVMKLYKFIQKYPETTATGYVVCPDRSDTRVSFDGLMCEDPVTLSNNQFKKDFNKFKTADDFKLNNKIALCWYD